MALDNQSDLSNNDADAVDHDVIAAAPAKVPSAEKFVYVTLREDKDCFIAGVQYKFAAKKPTKVNEVVADVLNNAGLLLHTSSEGV